MNKQRLWYIAFSPLWPEEGVFEHEGDDVDSSMPVFFTTRERAEAEQRDWNEAEWEDIPFAFGEKEVSTEQPIEVEGNESPDLEVFVMEAWLLAEHLRSSDISHIKLDDEIISTDNFLGSF